MPELGKSKYDVKPCEFEYKQKKYSIIGMESKHAHKRSGAYNMNLQNMNIRMKTGLKTINTETKYAKANFETNVSTDYKK